jgi:hypothetical protein
MGWSVTYTGIEGLSASYGVGEDTSVGNVGEGTAFKATYAYGPVTVGYSMYEFDTATASADNETTSYADTYTVNDELSVTWASEEIDETGDVEKVETSSIRASNTKLGNFVFDPGVIVVAADSPYKNLNDLLDAVIADPAKHAFAGGSAAGGFDHLKVLMALGKKALQSFLKLSTSV